MDSRKVIQMGADSPVIEAPKLRDFQPSHSRECDSCGARISRWDRFYSWLVNRHTSWTNMGYCAGGKPLSEPLPPVQQMMSGQEERRHSCAGVFEPHLHVSCKICGRSFLMRTKQPTE